MFQIVIDKKIKLDEIDDLYDKLDSHVKSGVFVDLHLPKELENNYWGLIPSLYQFSITWARSEFSSKLVLDIENLGEPDDKENEEFINLYENELLFPIVSLVWNKNEIVNKQGINLRKYLKPWNTQFFDRMLKAKPMKKGPKLLLTSFDHLPKDKGLLPCFETYNEFIKDEYILEANITPSLNTVFMYSSEAKKRFEYVKKPILGIIYELMKNTYEWAKDDENHVPLNPNIRGLYMKFFKKTRKNLLEDFKDHKGLVDYFSSDIHKENNTNELYFLEISVFDSGIGFVRRYAANNLSIENTNPVEIVKKCMILHSTSARGLGKDDKGIGLDRILESLDKKGFLRIKTGNVCVYRNMISHNHQHSSFEKDMDLFDWNRCSGERFTRFNEAAGSVITIIYPLSVTPLAI